MLGLVLMTLNLLSIPKPNRNVELLVDFMEEFNLFPANTKFMISKNKLRTFEYPNGAKAQLDYVLIRRK